MEKKRELNWEKKGMERGVLCFFLLSLLLGIPLHIFGFSGLVFMILFSLLLFIHPLLAILAFPLAKDFFPCQVCPVTTEKYSPP